LNDKLNQIETNNKKNTGDLFELQRATNVKFTWQTLKYLAADWMINTGKEILVFTTASRLALGCNHPLSR
jgi:hypothetical protein